MAMSVSPDIAAFMERSWPQIAPIFAELEARPLDAANVDAWLRDWSQLSRLLAEAYARLNVALAANTADKAAEARYFRWIETVVPPAEAADQKLKEKLLRSGLQPAGLDIALRNLGAEADLFREANLPLIMEESKLTAEYDKIIGAQTVTWDGRTMPVAQLRPVFEESDRPRRERAWRLAQGRQLEDRAPLNTLWTQLLDLRGRIAANAGCADYRAYAWRARQRFDYTPEDCASFHAAIETVGVPAASRVYERHRRRLGLETLRPWDLTDGWFGRPSPPSGQVALRPFHDTDELQATSAGLLRRVDPRLGDNFQTLVDERLLDLPSREGKAPGGFCAFFPATRRPYIFMNSVGSHDDVQTMLHEAGHAFHVFDSSHLPYYPQLNVPAEFAEVASMSMELLAAPYFPVEQGGFYSETDAARARVEHLEEMLLFWPFMAVVDAFQHWAYTHPAAAADADRCDDQWQSLWRRFIPAVDWSGLEAELATGWHRKLHIFQYPFYYVEYGLAALGATQVWRNARDDQQGAVARYRAALKLGGTATLPELYAAAGARFAFDAETLGEAVALIEATISELDPPSDGGVRRT